MKRLRLILLVLAVPLVGCQTRGFIKCPSNVSIGGTNYYLASPIGTNGLLFLTNLTHLETLVLSGEVVSVEIANQFYKTRAPGALKISR